MTGNLPGAAALPTTADHRYRGKWRAFAAIGVAFVTNVAAMSMVYVALPSIADDFGITLRSVSWVVIAQSLTISSLMLPMGRVADMIGRRRLHMIGLVLFGVGALAVALAPTFGLLIAARVLMSLGNAMGQSVGTAMVVAVFPPEERGKAIGAQTTAVAIGGASGPILAGLILQVLPWEAMFLLLLVPISIAFVTAWLVLDPRLVESTDAGPADRPRFDWPGAALSAATVTVLVLTLNNPLALPWLSLPIVLGVVAMVVLLILWLRWELRASEPMLDLSLFTNRVFSLAVGARFAGFMGSTFVFLLAPVYLISLRSMSAGQAAGVLFLNSAGMGIAAQVSGRLSDRLGSRGLSTIGFLLLASMALVFSTIDGSTPMLVVMPIVFTIGLSLGTWNVPNNSSIMGAVPAAQHGVVGALTNLTRNMGNVVGQAVATAVVVGVMASRGFDIPLSEIASSAAASDAFLAGWRWSFRIVALFGLIGLGLTLADPRRNGRAQDSGSSSASAATSSGRSPS